MRKLAAYRLPTELLDRLARVSRAVGVSRSQLVRTAVEREVREREHRLPTASTKIAHLHADLEVAISRAEAAEAADKTKQEIIERLLADVRTRGGTEAGAGQGVVLDTPETTGPNPDALSG